MLELQAALQHAQRRLQRRLVQAFGRHARMLTSRHQLSDLEPLPNLEMFKHNIVRCDKNEKLVNQTSFGDELIRELLLRAAVISV